MTIKSYVKIRPLKDDGAFSPNFNEVRKGINRTGKVTENIANNLVETHKLIQFEKEWLRNDTERQVEEDQEENKEEDKGFKKWFKGFKDMFRLKKREESTKDKLKEEEEEEEDEEKVKKEPKGIFDILGGFLTNMFKWIVMMGVLKWMSDPENAKKADKVFKFIIKLAKFAWKIASFGVGAIMGGLTKVFGAFEKGGNVIAKGFSFVLGALQLFAGFKTLQYLLNPLKLFTDVKKVGGLFRKVDERSVEAKKQAEWRKFGYKDKETGQIYNEKEYKQMKKSAKRKSDKLRKQGQLDKARSTEGAFNKRVGARGGQKTLNRAKGFGKGLMKPGMQGGLAVAGGLTRMTAGLASGEDATQAVGAGIGQAAGGMAGAALGTAFLGPFLGPFAPIVGNAIGSFLGEWVGKTFLPIIKPIFEPIKKSFQMWFSLVKNIAADTGITDFLGTFFKFVGEIAKVLFNIIGWVMKPITWLLGGAIKILGGIINFIIGAAKNIFAFMTAPFKFARRVLSFQDPGKDVKLEEFGNGGEMVIVQGKPARKLQSFAGGGPTKVKLTKEDIEPPTFVYSHQKFTSKTTERVRNGKLLELKQEEDYFEVMGAIYYHILLKHHEDILNKLISMRLIKPHITIRDLVEGKAGDKIDPKVLYTVYKNSVAQKMSDEESLKRTKAFYKRHNLKMGESWMASNFSEGGAVNNKEVWNPTVGRLSQTIPQGPDFDIQAFSDKRDMVMKQLDSKQRRDSDMDDFMILPPKLITIKETQPVINNVGSAPTKAVYVSPSPMLTC